MEGGRQRGPATSATSARSHLRRRAGGSAPPFTPSHAPQRRPRGARRGSPLPPSSQSCARPSAVAEGPEAGSGSGRREVGRRGRLAFLLRVRAFLFSPPPPPPLPFAAAQSTTAILEAAHEGSAAEETF